MCKCWPAVIAGLCVLSLSGCLDGDDAETESQTFLPGLAIDFPNFPESLSTDGVYFDVSGLAIGTTAESVPASVAFSLNGQETSIPKTSPLNFFYWLERFSNLTAGSNTLTISANAQSGQASENITVVSGSDYLRETAIQYHVAGTQWYVLDSARKALLRADFPTLASGDPMGRTLFSDDSLGTGPLFFNPVDFAIDETGARAIVVDQESAQLIAVDLANGNRSFFALTGESLLRPVAIDIDQVNGLAYVLDQQARSVVEVTLADGTARTITAPAIPACESDGTQPGPYCNDLLGFGSIQDCDNISGNEVPDCDGWRRLESPVDLVYQEIGGLQRLFIANFQPEGGEIVIVELNGGTNGEGARTLLDSPLDRDLDDATESVQIRQFGRLILDTASNTRLFAVSYGVPGFPQRSQGVLAVDVSNDYGDGITTFGEEGAQHFLSLNGVVQNGNTLEADADDYNFFGFPEALAFAAISPGDHRLLVLDTWLGTTADIDPVASDAKGERTLMPGGATLNGSIDTPAFATSLAAPALGTTAGVLGPFVSGADFGDFGGVGYVAINRATNLLVEFSLSANGFVSERPYAVNCLEVSECTAEELAADENASFQNPQSLLVDSDSLVNVADAGSDRIVQVLTDETRVVLSDVQSTSASPVAWQNPLGQVISRFVDSGSSVNELYVLDAGLQDVVRVDLNADETTDNRVALGLTCLADPSSFVLHADESDPDNIMRRLLIAERSAEEIKIVELDNSNTCTTLPYSGSPGSGNMNVVDLALDPAFTTDEQATLLLLDRENGEILSLDTDFGAGPGMVDLITGAGKPLVDGDNLFKGARSIAVSGDGSRIFVFDNIINSFYVVDKAARDDINDNGERVDLGDPKDFDLVSGRRYVISRGVSMSCDPADYPADACDFSAN